MERNLIPIEWENERIMTTKTLAECYGASEKNINDNFSNNKERFEEGKHYIKLEGKLLKEFKNSLPDEIGEPLKFAPKLILWTERGALRHAKILDTDEAWEVYEELEVTYFKVREFIDNPYKNLSKELQAIFIHDEKIQKIEEDIKQLQNDVPLYTSECEILQNKLKAKIVKLLGGKSKPAYRNASLRKKSYIDIQNQIKREFGVNSYKAIARKNYQKALEIIDNYTLPTVLNDQVIKLNNQTQLEL